MTSPIKHQVEWTNKIPLGEFVKKFRAEIDRIIRKKYKAQKTITDREREVWIVNDKELLEFAKKNGLLCK